MRFSTVVGLAMGLALAANVMAQPAGGGGGGRGNRGAGGFGMMGQDQFQQVLTNLGDVNLRPDFNLTKEQKEKIQAIRDDVKKAEEKWRTDNAEQLKKLTADAQAAREAQDQDKMREIMTKRMELTRTMPTNEDAAKQIRAVLTEDQAKALDARTAERRQEMMNRMGGMGIGGRGGRGGAGGGGGQ